jgi:hypothetical protein
MVSSLNHSNVRRSFSSPKCPEWVGHEVKVKQSHYRPWGFQEVDAPRFQDSRHMKVVRLSVLRTGCLYRPENFLVLISLRGWVNPRAIVQPEGLRQWKIPVTPWGIEPMRLWLVAQCLHQLCYHVPHLHVILRLGIVELYICFMVWTGTVSPLPWSCIQIDF